MLARFSALSRPFVARSGLLGSVRRFQSTLSSTLESSTYPGAQGVPFTNELEFRGVSERLFPIFRMMDKNGDWVCGEKDIPTDITESSTVAMYEAMVRENIMDTVLYEAQRQGRISFYMTSYGEEALQIGSAAGLHPEDEIFAQYREAGVLLWRGFTLDQIMSQCFGAADDTCKGRQMPVHYGSKVHHYQTVSSPLATQIPHAAGAGYALKLDNKKLVSFAYFGDGAASEGDFHAALNFAATLGSQTIFFCRNNGFAISTPVEDQYRGDGIVSRGPGYGVACVRVDGNDLFAVREVTRRARDICINEHRPVLIEAMTYRVGHHSTSDDSSRYRGVQEVQYWKTKENPINRIRQFMERNGWWNEERDVECVKRYRAAVLEALQNVETKAKPTVEDLFTDVYDTVPLHLQRQYADLREHIAKYPDVYTTSGLKQHH